LRSRHRYGRRLEPRTQGRHHDHDNAQRNGRARGHSSSASRRWRRSIDGWILDRVLDVQTRISRIGKPAPAVLLEQAS